MKSKSHEKYLTLRLKQRNKWKNSEKCLQFRAPYNEKEESDGCSHCRLQWHRFKQKTEKNLWTQ